MPEDNAPNFQIGKGTLTVEADAKAVDEALDRIDKRLDAIKEKFSSIFDTKGLDAFLNRLKEAHEAGDKARDVGPLVQAQAWTKPPTPDGGFHVQAPTTLPFDIDKEMDSAIDFDERRRTNDLLTQIRDAIVSNQAGRDD